MSSEGAPNFTECDGVEEQGDMKQERTNLKEQISALTYIVTSLQNNGQAPGSASLQTAEKNCYIYCCTYDGAHVCDTLTDPHVRNKRSCARF